MKRKKLILQRTVETGYTKKEGTCTLMSYNIFKNEKTGTLFLSMLFHNGTDKTLNKIKVKITSYDYSGTEIGEQVLTTPVFYGYVDRCFSNTTLIELENNRTDSVECDLVEIFNGNVLFPNNEIPEIVNQKNKSNHHVGLIVTCVILALICFFSFWFIVGLYLLYIDQKDIIDLYTSEYAEVISEESSSEEESDEASTEIESTTVSVEAETELVSTTQNDDSVAVSALPSELQSFIYGCFYINGTITDIQNDVSYYIRLSVDGDNWTIFQSDGGLNVGLMSYDDEVYYLNSNNNSYLPVTDEVLELLSKTADDYILDYFRIDEISGYSLTSATVNGDAGFCLTVNYTDDCIDKLYYANGSVIVVDCYDSENTHTYRFIAAEFLTTIPDDFASLSSWTLWDGTNEEFFIALAE